MFRLTFQADNPWNATEICQVSTLVIEGFAAELTHRILSQEAQESKVLGDSN